MSLFSKSISNNFSKVSEPTWEDVSIKPSADGSVKIGDMIMDKFQFNIVNGAALDHEPGDGVAFSGISPIDGHRWPNAELPYEYVHYFSRSQAKITFESLVWQI